MVSCTSGKFLAHKASDACSIPSSVVLHSFLFDDALDGLKTKKFFKTFN